MSQLDLSTLDYGEIKDTGPPMPSKPWDFDAMARPAQRYAVERIHSIWDEGRGALGLSCIGTGKTVVGLTALVTYDKPWRRCLIIGPPNVADSTWPDETRVWKHLNKISVVSTVGLPPKKREEIMRDESIRIVSMSCDTKIIKWFFGLFKPRKIPFDVLFIDEIDKFKDTSAQRHKFLKRRVGEFRYRLAQTGSPADESLLEIYPQAKLVQPDVWNGMSWTAFKNTWFYPENAFVPYSKMIPHAGTRDKIYETIEPITYRVAREDMGDMPERVILTDILKFDAKTRKQYDALEKDFLLEVGEELQIPVGSAGVLHSKLKQMCDGFIYDEDHVAHIMHNLKVRRTMDLRDQLKAQGKQLLILYRFAGTGERIGVPYIGQGVSQGVRRKLIREFQDGTLQCLAIHPASAGHGLNLHLGGCHHMLLFGIDQGLRLYNQGTGRIDRQGQRHTVYEIRLVMENSVDIDVYKSLQRKGHGAKTVLDAMKERVGWK